MPITARMMWRRRKLKKKTDDALTVVMDKNPDILKTLGERKKGSSLLVLQQKLRTLLIMPKKKLPRKTLI